MKYRIQDLKITIKPNKKRVLKAKRRGSTSICLYRPLPEKSSYEQIVFDSLFAMGALPEAKKPPLRKRLALKASKLWRKAKALLIALWSGIKKLFRRLFGRPSQPPSPTAFLAGAMCAAVCVTAISAATVLIGLFGRFFAPYEELVIPTFIGEELADIEQSIAQSTEQNADQRYELLVAYKNSDTVPAGVVISQSPSPNVTRKLFRSDKYCTITVTVSSGKHFYAVEDLSGMTERDALLALHNSGVAVEVVQEHSDTVPLGNVIFTVPAADQRLYDGETLVLHVSLGKEIPTVSVPDLYALSESQALTALKTRGLRVGKITYAASQLDAGKVVAQQYAAYSKIQQESTVDITVSLGRGYTQKTVPDLFGLTAEQAARKLAEVGLVIGSIYSVASGAPAGTVVAQSPIAQTPITSTINSVDIYVSS